MSAAEAEAEDSPLSDRRSIEAQQHAVSRPTAQQEAKLPSGRVVATRTHFCVSFSPSGGQRAPLPADAAGAAQVLPDLRGWSSPHGEPYRPLGKPDLSLKFTPRLADGSSLLQNAHRMRVFEGSKQQHAGDSGGHDALKDKEVRGASETGMKDASQSKPALFELFPFNVGSNRKRALDERQVRFAYRLQESVANYSPVKVQGLQQRPRAHSPTRAGQRSEGGQHASGSDSFVMLKEALHECSSRLRLVRNGASLLGQLQAEELPMLLELQSEYLREREHALEIRSVRSSISQLGGLRQGRTLLASARDDRSEASSAPGGLSVELEERPGNSSTPDDGKYYLPYTTRQPQLSPHRYLPSLDDVRAKVREEKYQVPVRPVRSSLATVGQQPNRRSTGRPSRINSVAASGGGKLLLAGQTNEPLSSIASRPSQVGDLVGQVGATAMHRPSHALDTGAIRPEIPDKSDDRTGVTRDGKAVPPRSSPTKLHSVERLQAVVSAIAEVRTKQSTLLAHSLESLDQDRRDCLALKFKSFSVEHHVDDDLVAMRKRSEMQRVQHIEQTLESLHWYEDLLRKVLAREGSGPPPHPAELFIVTAIRRLAHEGRELTAPLLFELLRHIHVDDFVVGEVQDMLLFLRDVVPVSSGDWVSFFSDHSFHMPIEMSERKPPAPEPTLHHLGGKLRAVVKASQLLRHMSDKG